MKKLIFSTILIATAIGLSACSTTNTPSSAALQNAQNNTITVTSTKSVQIVPDIAQIVFGIRTEAPDPNTCQSQNTEATNRVIDFLLGMGIDETSIQTSGLGLNPRYDWKSDVQTIIGYEMNTSITLSDLPIEQVGEFLTESVNAGVNYITSVSYQSSQYDASYNEAMDLAIKAAADKAASMAAAANCTLDEVASIEEGSKQPAIYSARNQTADSYAAADSMRVMPGELSVEAQVTITYKIK